MNDIINKTLAKIIKETNNIITVIPPTPLKQLVGYAAYNSNGYSKDFEEYIDYKIGDYVSRKDSPEILLGVCTGFKHANTCIVIDFECYGGKNYFRKF